MASRRDSRITKCQRSFQPGVIFFFPCAVCLPLEGVLSLSLISPVRETGTVLPSTRHHYCPACEGRVVLSTRDVTAGVPVLVCYGHNGVMYVDVGAVVRFLTLQPSSSCLASAFRCRSVAHCSPNLIVTPLSIRATTASLTRTPCLSVCLVGTSLVTLPVVTLLTLTTAPSAPTIIESKQIKSSEIRGNH